MCYKGANSYSGADPGGGEGEDVPCGQEIAPSLLGDPETGDRMTK